MPVSITSLPQHVVSDIVKLTAQTLLSALPLTRLLANPVNGVDGGQYCTYHGQLVSDIRLMVL